MVWSRLYLLSAKDCRSFETCRKLRQHNFTSLQIYHMLRLSKHMEEPHRSRAQRQLRRIMQFRGMEAPVSANPLIIPFLSHHSFQADIKTCVKSIIQACKRSSTLIPLHWPCSTIVEAAPRKIDTFLFNWKTFASSSERHCPPKCTCHALCQAYPFLCDIRTNGHVAGNLQDAALPS